MKVYILLSTVVLSTISLVEVERNETKNRWYFDLYADDFQRTR